MGLTQNSLESSGSAASKRTTVIFCKHWPGQTTCGWCDLGYEPPADGVLHYRLYSQDGRLIEMTCQNTKDMRRFCAFTRERDRYGERDGST